ncbi:hypothetical protein FHU41_000961 [Psychromicrobium silvestre]|uniref:Uncharacterized protein n=1 Tax=Psychromicrobium silvestre TaxID=1645614 RepID=A0A7Y9LSG5_9MICC|nr:hypothetical protein [Psychromicrobium silvestre]NYE94740.1 hypothetical protein [Psychromicrobium silvestre]
MKHEVFLEYVGDSPSGVSPDPSDPTITSLEFVLDHHGGYTFDFEFAHGVSIPVSLELFRGKDPKTTFIRLGVKSQAESSTDQAKWDAKILAQPGKSSRHS